MCECVRKVHFVFGGVYLVLGGPPMVGVYLVLRGYVFCIVTGHLCGSHGLSVQRA